MQQEGDFQTVLRPKIRLRQTMLLTAVIDRICAKRPPTNAGALHQIQ